MGIRERIEIKKTKTNSDKEEHDSKEHYDYV